MWHVTCDMWHMTHDTWHKTLDMWHMTYDRWEEVNLLSKCQLPSSYGLGVRDDMWHLTCDTWHVTPDTWHMTPNIWDVSRDTQGVMKIVSKFQLPRSFGLGVKVSWRFWTKGWLAEWMNESIIDEAVCRTAPATPGLLIRKGWPAFKGQMIQERFGQYMILKKSSDIIKNITM